jgi:hypothetical protein
LLMSLRDEENEIEDGNDNNAMIEEEVVKTGTTEEKI